MKKKLYWNNLEEQYFNCTTSKFNMILQENQPKRISVPCRRPPQNMKGVLDTDRGIDWWMKE